jgi:NAD(P) transhydrogenase subunit alpha
VQSLGATFLEFDLGESAEGAGGYAKELTPEQQERQRAWMVEQIAKNDVVITTAAVPGKRAPVLISEAAIAAMKPGSVIVDLAAETGGNSALTKPGETVVTPNGVTIIGTTNLPSTMPYHASQLYSRNVHALLSPWLKDGVITIDMNDEIAKGAVVAHDGATSIGGQS